MSTLVDSWEPITLPDDYEPVSFNWAGITPVNDYRTVAEEDMADFVREASGGKIDITVHPAGTLVGPADLTAALRDGTAGIAEVFPAYAPSGYDMDTWIGKMAWMPVDQPVLGDLQAMAASMDWSYNEPLEQEFEAQGVIPLMPKFATFSSYNLLCTKNISSLDDAKGTVVRIPGPAWESEVEALGMEGLQLSATEVFEGMQRGLYECFMGAPRNMHTYDLLDLGEYLILGDDASFTPFYTDSMAANPELWEQLGPEGREIIKRGLAVYVYSILREELEADVEGLEYAKKIGLDIVPMPSDVSAALKRQQEKQLQNAVESAPDSIKSEARALRDSYVATFDKWRTKLEDMGYAEYGASWDEFFADGHEVSDIDLKKFVEVLWDEVIDPNIETDSSA